MCQYSSVDGHPTDWHLVHLGSFARGGAGLVMQEATAVTAEGRISPWDAGIWTEAQAADYRRITDFVRSQGAVAGIQLAHAGRKGSSRRPWEGRGVVPPTDGGWLPVGPATDPYPGLATPTALTTEQVRALVADWRAAAAPGGAARPPGVRDRPPPPPPPPAALPPPPHTPPHPPRPEHGPRP